MPECIDFTIFPSSVCNTGCSHCMHDCGMKNPQFMDPVIAERIVSECETANKLFSVGLTGYGEPLFAPSFCELIDTFCASQNLEYLGLISSGFLADEEEKRKRLWYFLQFAEQNRIVFEQSFNLYNKSFTKRVRNSLLLALENPDTVYLIVRMCFGFDNYAKTWSSLEESLNKTAKACGLKVLPLLGGLTDSEARSSLADVLSLLDPKMDNLLELSLVTNAIPRVFIIHKEGEKRCRAVIIAAPHFLSRDGRAEAVGLYPIDEFRCYAYSYNLRNKDYRPMDVYPDGTVKVGSCAHHVLGQVGEDSIIEMDERHRRFINDLHAAIICDQRHFGAGQDICRVCRYLVAEKKLKLR